MSTPAAARPVPGERERLWLSATFTADSLRAPLELLWDVLGVEMELRLAPYAQLFQQLLDPASGLRQNRRGANVLLLRWDDLAGAPPAADASAWPGWREKLRRVAAELAEAVVSAPLQAPTLLLLAPSGAAEGTPAQREIALVEQELRERTQAAAGLALVDAGQVARRYPVASWSDPESERFGHVPFTPEYFAALAAVIARWHYGVVSRPRKVLVLDCDNTLWGGVVGEDGPLGVRVDGPYAALQRFAAEQAEAGRLVALCSKNEEADVLEVFARRPEMPLQRRHVTAHRIGWGAKSGALRELAAELDLGLDGFVFIDDNPLECAEVRAHCPEVLTLELPVDPAGIPGFLAHVWALDAERVTDEDRQRVRMYADNVERSRLRRAAPSLGEFLDSLQLEVEIRGAAPDDVPRAAQLTQRTNQFNAGQTRLSEAEVSARLGGDRDAVFVVRARDRFGDYGIVGVIGARALESELAADVFLLSCRALGRGVEHRMLAQLGAEAQRRRLARVAIPFRPSERNTPARRFLERVFGASAGADAETWFRMASSDAARLQFDPGAEGESGPPEQERAESRDAAAARPGATPSESSQRIAAELTSGAAIVRALAARTRARPSLSQGYVEPRRGLERSIADAWQQVLRIDRVGARDSFRDLGGQSFDLVLIHRQLLDRIHVDLDITTLFQYPTVAELAAYVESEASVAAGLDAVAGRAQRMRAAFARQAAARRGPQRG